MIRDLPVSNVKQHSPISHDDAAQELQFEPEAYGESIDDGSAVGGHGVHEAGPRHHPEFGGVEHVAEHVERSRRRGLIGCRRERVRSDEEYRGLDGPEHGVLGVLFNLSMCQLSITRYCRWHSRACPL